MRLALYGTLRPGATHHHEVRSISGTWEAGTVRGWCHEITWGPADGFDGITLDPDAPPVAVDILHSDDLPRHLDRLDRFEGPGYRRVTTTARLPDGTDVAVEIYEADPEA